MSKTVQVIDGATGQVKVYDISQVNLSIKNAPKGKRYNHYSDIKVTQIDKEKEKQMLEQGYTIKQIYNKRYNEKQKEKRKQLMKKLLIENSE